MRLIISLEAIEFIKNFEQWRGKLYLCPAGKATIGYGHVLKPRENIKIITKKQGEQLLLQDIAIAEQAVARNIHVKLAQSQFDALVSFTFNVGGGALQRSSLRQKINYGAGIEDIRNEFMRWVYAGGKKLPGLIHRRVAEWGLYLNND